jgi:hypothetical protein
VSWPKPSPRTPPLSISDHTSTHRRTMRVCELMKSQ